MKSHTLGRVRNFLTRTEEKSRNGGHQGSFPASTFPKACDVRQRPNFRYPSLMSFPESCPESGSATAVETSPHEATMKYDHSHGCCDNHRGNSGRLKEKGL